jgi:photosystem II stability/assembly factor-like uncharacterized protein
LSLAIIVACGGAGGSPSATPTPTPTPSPDPDGWEVLLGSPLSPPQERHDDLIFVDPNNGWLVNVRAEVHATHDGGTTWAHIADLPNVIFPRSVGFASLSKGWIGNLNLTSGDPVPNSALWETLDGGHTWTNISHRIAGPNVVGLCGMRVLNPNFIVAVGRWNGPPLFVKSTDGGKTWTSRSLSPLVNGLVDVSFLNEREGFAVGALGDGATQATQDAAQTVILATTDGGESWQVRYTSPTSGQRAWKIQFANELVGYVTTEGSHPQGVVLKTTDGGTSWVPLLVSPDQSFEAVGFVDPDHGWVASPDTIYSTADGGATWKPLFFGTNVNRMRVLNDSLVFACGDRVYRWKRS